MALIIIMIPILLNYQTIINKIEKKIPVLYIKNQLEKFKVKFLSQITLLFTLKFDNIHLDKTLYIYIYIVI